MKKIYVLFLGLIVLGFNPVFANEKVEVKFSKCVDGDTAKFVLDNKEITARFLAVDTPETVHPTKEEEPFGKEASNYTCEKLTNAKEIILEYDDGSDKFDKYDRHLVWVHYDNNFLQEELISLGYAKVAYLYGEYKYTEDLQNKEIVAKSEKAGIWGDYEFVDIEEEYIVTFSYNGKSKKVEVIGGNSVVPISNPKKENYKFLGWYLDEEIYDFSLPVEKNITLVAKFEKIDDEIPIYVYIISGIIVVIAITTNYKGSRNKLRRKVKSSVKKKLMKN
ncbi:MAG: thermonuclease family protein [Bacilli bacterium]|nr:thermonuclease family protein [Bacilli bacterium]